MRDINTLEHGEPVLVIHVSTGFKARGEYAGHVPEGIVVTGPWDVDTIPFDHPDWEVEDLNGHVIGIADSDPPLPDMVPEPE